MTKFRYIDALRGWAILLVLMIHSTGFGSNDNLPSFFAPYVKHGARGVQLFFIASALTLCLSYRHRSAIEAKPVRNFFIRRFFRIAPLYYIGIVLYLTLLGFGPRYWLGDAAGISVLNILSNFLFLHGLSPYWINSIIEGGWSITVEVFFYLIFPALFFLLNNLSKALLAFVATSYAAGYLSAQLASWNPIAHQELWNNFLFLYFPTQLPVFILGIFLYHLICGARASGTTSLEINPYILAMSLVLLLWNPISGIYVTSLLFVFIALIMSRWSCFLWENPLICFLGRISYGLYICHWAILTLMVKFNVINFFPTTTGTLSGLNYCSRFAVLLLVGSTLAYLLHISVEKPFQRLGAKLIARWEANSNK